MKFKGQLTAKYCLQSIVSISYLYLMGFVNFFAKLEIHLLKSYCIFLFFHDLQLLLQILLMNKLWQKHKR